MKNARPLLLAASAVALLISACSQAPANLEGPTLAPQFGSADDDYGGDVAVTQTQQVFMLSSQKGYAYDDGGEAYGLDQKAFLTQYDTSGNRVWSKEVASYVCDWGRDEGCDANSIGLNAEALELDAQGHVYALVSRNGVAYDEANVTHYYVYKTDLSGKTVNKVDVGISGGLFGSDYKANNSLDVAVDSGGAIYVAKRQYDYNPYSETDPHTNVIAKYTTNGTLVWQRTSTVGVPKGIVVAASGNVYVVGSTGVSRYTNSGGLTWTKSGGGDDITISGSNLYVRKGTTIRRYDGSGNLLWAKTQSGLTSPVFTDMTGDGSGNVYLTGKVSTVSSGRDAFIRKLSTSGSALFTKTYGTTAYDDARGIATLSGSEIYVTGETQGSLTHTNRGGLENRDGYLRKLNSSGNTVWTR